MNEEKSLNMSENESLIKFKFILLNGCIEESIMLIKKGIELFRKIHSENNEKIAFLSFIFLSRGFELLMKNIIICKYFEEKKEFISSRILENYGHDLIKLRIKISKNYESSKINNKEIKNRIDEDKNFLESQELKDILGILNHFANAKKGRYYAFNFLESKSIKELEYPINKLNCIILNRIKNNIPRLQEESEENKKIFNYFWNREVNLCLPFLIYKFLIVLTRQFNYGFLGKKVSKGRSTLISLYACMTNKDINMILEKNKNKDEINIELN